MKLFEFCEKLCRNLGETAILLLVAFVLTSINFFFSKFTKLFPSFIFTLLFTRPIKLVVAKCWDPNPKGYFTIPRTEPVRPIDPGAWVAHTAAIRGNWKVMVLISVLLACCISRT